MSLKQEMGEDVLLEGRCSRTEISHGVTVTPPEKTEALVPKLAPLVDLPDHGIPTLKVAPRLT